MKLRNQQAGFNSLVIAIVVVVIGLAGAGGWFVYNQRQKNKQTDNQTQKSITNFDECVAAGNPIMESYPEQCAADGKTFVNEKQKDTQKTAGDETANWLVYTAKGGAFTVRLADGWVVDDGYYSQGFNTFDNTKLAPKPGTKAVVNPYPGGRDGATGFFFNYATQNIEQIVTPGQKQASLKTKDGLEIEKYYWVVSGQTNEGMGVQNGDTEYTYVIRQNAKSVISVSYSFNSTSKDYHDIVEKVLTTVHFN